MEPTPEKPVKNNAMDENYNQNKILHVLVAAFPVEEKTMISNLLLEDFKQFFIQMGPSVANPNLFKKARFLSCFGYNYRVNFYEQLKIFIIDHLKNVRKPYVLSKPKYIFLKSLTSSWETYIEALTTINNVMDYMESIHSGHSKVEHFDKFAIILFRKLVFQDVDVQRRFFASLSELKEVTTRDSILLSSDRLLVEDISKMCYSLRMEDCYELCVKPLFLKLTTEYFQSLSNDYLLKYFGCAYFENANAKVIEEMDRIQLKLDTESINEIYGIIMTELFLKNMKTVLEIKNCGIVCMLKNNQFEDLRRMYNILGFVDSGVKVMFDSMCPYFCKLGTSIVLKNKEISDAFTCIQSLLDLIKKFNYLLKNVFNRNKLFYDIIGDEFSIFLKLNSLIPKFLCQFIDEKLRKGNYMFIKKHTIADLRKVVFLVELLQDKSSFEEFYQNSLVRRLLYCESVNVKLENIMIRMLKRVFARPHGNSLFIPRIERMYKDKFLLSKSIMNKYNERVLVDKCILGIMQPFDLNVDVLSAVNWPVEFPQSMCKVPQFALNAFNEFKKFYLKDGAKKTLKLLPQYGTVELEVTFYNQLGATKRSCDGENSTTKIERVEQKFNIVVSTYQMFVLELFNSNNSLTYETILKETMIPERSLLFSLHKLMYTHKILIKRPICKEIKLNDTFHVRKYLECR